MTAAVLLGVAVQGTAPALAAGPAVRPAPAVRSRPAVTAKRVEHKAFLQRPIVGGTHVPLRASLSSVAANAAPLGGTPWKPLGPQPINGLLTFGPSAGRITAVAASGGSIIFAGAADGGVWRSPDGGNTWAPTGDSQVTLAVGALAVDWSTTPSETVYAGTGEGNGCQDCLAGQGVLKSTDGGATWVLLGQSTFAGAAFTGLAVNGQTVVAATNQGLYVSTNGGLTWPASPTVSGRFDALSQDPVTPSLVWAAITTSCTSPSSGTIGVWNSANSSWTVTWPGSNPAPPGPVTRIGLGAGPNGTVYAALAACQSSSPAYADGQLEEILKLTNGVSGWQEIKPGGFPGSLTDYFSVGVPGVAQGWYDNVVAVDPNDATGNTAVFGGVTLLTTLDGGASFTDVANPYSNGPLHPDFHALAFVASDTFYAGNDGGVYYTTDLGGDGTAGHWINRSSGLDTTQFYAGTSLDLTHLAGGSQDNGTAGNPQGAAPSAWLSLLDGDGGWTAMIPGSSTMFGEVSGLDIFQFDYSGAGQPIEVAPCSTAHQTDPACTQPTGFTAPFVMDPTSTTAANARLYAGTNHVYRTTSGGLPNGGTTTTGTWTSISNDLTTGSGGTVHPPDWVHMMAIGSAKFHGTLITGSWFGKVFMTTNADTASPTWVDITGSGATGLPSWSLAVDSGNAWITGLALNPLDNKEAWVTIGTVSGGRVWHTTNASSGQWSDISSTLPSSLVVTSITVDPIRPQNVYLGTDAGTLACASCGGATPAPSWVPLGAGGLPNVRVDALTITSDDLYLVAWTHGRGAWSLPRPYPTPGGRLDPSSLSFGQQTVGTASLQKTVTLTSTGTANLNVTTVSVAGDFALDLASLANPCPSVPFTLPPNAHCDFGIRFQPRAAGSRGGTLSVFDNGADTPQSAALDGTGVNPGWRSLGGLIYSGPQASTSSPNRTDVFVRGADNGLWHRWFNGSSWSNWEALGGVMNSDPAAVASANGRIDVFTRGTDDHLWQMTFDGVRWTTWKQVDALGVLASAPAVCSPAPGRLDIFVRGTDNQLWHKVITNGTTTTQWTSADGRGGILDSEPSAVSWGNGRIDVFIRGTDQQLWHMWTSDSTNWHTWTRVGNGVLGSRPAAATWGASRLDVFVKGTDNRLWHMWTNDGNTWTNWTDADDQGGVLGSGPGAVSPSQGIIDVFARGTDSAVWYIRIPGS
jgi:hypothetical protein